MELKRIPMLSRGDTVSHIMPYFANTHKAFLLLSALCSASRGKLNQFYNGFILHMKEYGIRLDISSDNIEKSLFLPCDLFKINVQSITKDDFETFVRFIGNVSNSDGGYFNDHYMHRQIQLGNSISIGTELVESLHPYLDILKSIKVSLVREYAEQISLNMAIKIAKAKQF